MSRRTQIALVCLIALALPPAARAKEKSTTKTPIGHKIAAFGLKDYLGKTW